MEDGISIRVRVGNFEIQVDGLTRNDATNIVDSYLDRYVHLDNLKLHNSKKDSQDEHSSIYNKKLSINEFVRKANPHSGPEYATVIGFYLEQYEGREYFTSSDIKNGFSEIRFKHRNPSDALLKARNAGRIMDSVTRTGYVLTRTGEDWVRERIND